MAQQAILLDAEAAAALANVLYDSERQAESDRAEYIGQLNANRELYRPVQDREAPPWEGACNLHVPLLRYARNAMFARIRRALLGSVPFFFVESRDPQQQEWAGCVEAFLQEQCRRQLRLGEALRPILQSPLDEGTGVAYLRWKETRRRRLRYVRAAEGPIVAERRLELVYDGPEIAHVPIDAMGTFPAANGSVQESTGVYLRIPSTGNDLLNGVVSGDYDGAAVESLRAWSGEASGRSDDALRGIATTNAATDPSFHNRPFLLTEWYYRYARAAHEPAEDWLITLHAPTRTVLRAIPNPWGHGLRPIVPLHVLPPKFGILGESLPDLAGQPQRFITLLMQLMVDSMSLRIWPELFIGQGMTPDEFKKFARERGPGKFHKLNTDDIQRAVRTLDVGVSPNEALPLIEMLRQWAERASGVTDSMLGRTAPRQMTATEMEAMLQEGQELVLSMTDAASEGLTRIGELLLALDYEYAGHASIQQLWHLANPRAPVDALTALAAPYDVEAAGTTTASNRAVRKQRALELFTTLRDDPFVAADPSGRRQYQLRKTLLVDGFNVRNPESLIGTEEEAGLIG